jgi:hypothetical protein
MEDSVGWASFAAEIAVYFISLPNIDSVEE